MSPRDGGRRRIRLERQVLFGPTTGGAEGEAGGEGGIRTHGSFHYIRFPGVPDRPLQHLSAVLGPAVIVASRCRSGSRYSRGGRRCLVLASYRCQPAL